MPKFFQKIFLVAFFFFALSVSAKATDITIQGFTIPNYQRTSAPKVRVYYSQTFTDSGGVVIPSGSPAAGSVYKIITTTLTSGTVSVPSFTIPSTEDGIDNRSSRVTFYLYDGNAQLQPNPLDAYNNLRVPETIQSSSGCGPAGTCCTLAELKVWNTASPPLPPDTYYTKRDVDRLLQGIAGGGTISLTAGSAGSDFNISGTSPNFTINLPAASATASGKVTTGTQTFAGNKTVSGTLGVTGANNFFLGTTTFAALGTPANGATIYCSNCQKTTPCTSGGTGAHAIRMNGAWDCGPTGTVTGFLFTDQNGITGTVTNSTTTPNLALALGAITPTSVNGYTLSGAGGTLTLGTGGTVAYRSDNLGVFSATTSAQLAGVISDETGSSLLVFNTSPTLVTPTLGVATATSINKVTITAPVTAATLTLADGSSFIKAGAHSLTLTTVGTTSLTLPTTGTLVTTTTTSLPNLAQVGTLTSGTAAGGFVLGPVTVTLGSDATGDMYYRNASGVLTRVGAGSLGTVLTMGASSVPYWTSGSGGGSPGGSNTQLQYNASSVFGGISGVISDGTNLTISTLLNSCQDAGGTDTYACSLAPAITAYATGQIFWFKANTANIGVATLNLNSVGAKTIKKQAGGVTTDLSDNDIRAGQWVEVMYDGTNFQMLSMLGNAAGGGGGTPGGSNGQFQYNGAGSFSGAAGLATDGTNVTASGKFNSCLDLGSTDAYACSLAPAPSAYATGQLYWFKANTSNTGAATANFNSLGAKSIVKYRGGAQVALNDNDIIAGQWVALVYDGTSMQLISPIANAVTPSGSTSTIQYNVDGLAFGGITNFTTDGSTPTFGTFAEFTRITSPGNPLTGKLRIFANNSTGKLACLDSSGADCMPSAGSTPGGTTSQIQYNAGGTLGGISSLTTDGTIVTQKVGTNFNFVDPSDTTKQVQFAASGVSTGTTRTKTFQNTSGTLAETGNTLGDFAATTSAQLASTISDETGSGSLVFGTSGSLTTPTITNGTLVTPTIADYTNATHDHSTTAQGGNISTTAVASGNKTGNGLKFATGTGTYVSGNCVSIDANGNLVDYGSPCVAGGGGGTINGTGSTGKIAKFTAATTIGDSILTESSGKIGISAASPAAVLDVNGDVNIESLSTPALSAANHAKFYFDSTRQRLQLSTNGSPFIDFPPLPDQGVISGCGLAYTGTGLSYTIAPGTFALKGQVYASNGGGVTLAAADPTFSRFDQFVINTDGSVGSVTGTPAANPVLPNINDQTQIAIAFILVPANATTPPNTSLVNIYLENTEWTSTSSAPARINPNSTTNPYAGSKDIEFTAALNNDNIIFDKGSSQDMTSVTSLNMFVYPKASWNNRTIAAQFLDASNNVLGTAVTIGNGRFGFVDTTTSYQQITIPASTFALQVGDTPRKLRLRVSGGGASIGAYIDNITLQLGTPNVGGGGTVVSVALSLPTSVFAVSGSPVTTNGTLTGTFNTQTANTVFAGPTTGAAAVPAFRALVAADIPALDASKITTGSFSVSVGGTGASTFTANGVLYGNNTSAVQVTAQGAANSILVANAGAPSFSQTPTINTSLTIGVASSQVGSLILRNAVNANTLTLRPGTTGSNLTFTLPTADGGAGTCLKTDGSGNLSFGSCGGGGGGTPGGSDTQLQYNAAGSFGGITTLTTDGTVVTQQAGTNFLLVDPSDTSKKARFDVSNIAVSTTRVVNIPDASSTTVQADAGASNQFLTAISSQGVISKAQPAFSNISGTATVAQGGTGQTSYTDGQLLIGNTATGGLSKATITAGSNISITNGNGTITIDATSGGSGTVNSGTQYQLAYYAATGTAVSGNSAITTAADNSLNIAQGTLAAASTGFSHTATWNNSGATFTGWSLLVTDTNSAAASKLLTVTSGGTNGVTLTKGGAMSVGHVSSNSVSNNIQGLAVGDTVTLSGDKSFGGGFVVSVGGIQSIGYGGGVTASGQSSAAFNQDSTASGNYSHATGLGTTASGTESFTAGAYVRATATGSMMFGVSSSGNNDAIVNSTASSFGIGFKTNSSGLTAPQILFRGRETSGSPNIFKIAGTTLDHTGLAASTEASDVFWDLNRTVQFATGALTTQRAVQIAAPTYAFVGASTITTAATVAISGPPIAGTNATITTPISLWLQAGQLRVDTTTALARPIVTRNNASTTPFSISLADSTGTDYALMAYAGNTHDWVSNSAAGDIIMGTVGARRLLLSTNSAKHVTIESDGKVGINKFPPANILSILTLGDGQGVTIEPDATNHSVAYNFLQNGGSSVGGLYFVNANTGFFPDSTDNDIVVANVQTAPLVFVTDSQYRWSVSSAGHLLAFDDNTYDIGATGATRPANIYAGTKVQVESAANGAATTVQTASELLTLSTVGATTDTSANLLPANAIILAVTARITTSVAGVDSTLLEVGDGTTAGRFGSTGTLTSGTTVTGLSQFQGGVTTDAAGPVQTSAAKVRITLSGGADNTPSGGVVRITVHYISLTAPTS